jgi:hypothetical protein
MKFISGLISRVKMEFRVHITGELEMSWLATSEIHPADGRSRRSRGNEANPTTHETFSPWFELAETLGPCQIELRMLTFHAKIKLEVIKVPEANFS